MSKLFGKLYKGPIPEDTNVADFIGVEGEGRSSKRIRKTQTTPELNLERDSEIFSDAKSRFNPDIARTIDSKNNWIYSEKGPQPPATEEEAEEISRQVEAAKAELLLAKTEIESMQGAIEGQITDAEASGQDVSIELDSKSKAAVRRAIRRLFGGDKTNISLADYKRLLQARTELESTAVRGYVKGFPEEE